MAESTPLKYQDFELEITDLTEDGKFKLRVLGKTPDGREMRSDEAVKQTFNPEEFKVLVGKLERRVASKAELLTLGEKLGQLLLPGRLREWYESSLNHVRQKREGLRLRLRIEPLKLAALPWEYALVQRNAGEKVPSDFLCLQPDVSITRYETLGEPLQPAPDKEKFRVLIALANPIADPLPSLDVEADQKAILASLTPLTEKQAVETVVLRPATRDALIKAVPGSDIFHFAGHGVFESEGLAPDGTFRKRGRILLEKDDSTEDRFDSDLLANLLGGKEGIRLVILGACNTASRDEGGTWSGVAPALVQENVPAVVAMQFRLADASAPHFLANLYSLVLQGFTIDEAVSEGRRALFAHTGQANGDWAKDRDWGVPVLFLRAEDGVLFRTPTETETLVAPDGSPIVNARTKIGTLRGENITAWIDNMISGELNASTEIDNIPEGGKSTTVRIGTLGGSPSSRSKKDQTESN